MLDRFGPWPFFMVGAVDVGRTGWRGDPQALSGQCSSGLLFSGCCGRTGVYGQLPESYDENKASSVLDPPSCPASIMKHHVIKLTLGFIIIIAIVAGVVYWQWPRRLQRRIDYVPSSSTSKLDVFKGATTSISEPFSTAVATATKIESELRFNFRKDLWARRESNDVPLWWEIEDRASEYVVLRGESAAGPWHELGRRSADRANAVDYQPSTAEPCYLVEAVDRYKAVIRRYEPVCVP